MIVESNKVVKVDELASLIPFKAKATWSSLWQVFYYTRLLKYVHKKYYQKIKVSFNKICTHKNLQELCEMGYFYSPQKEIYCASNKVLPILKEVGYTIDILPPEPQGKGYINELHNIEVFIDALKVKHFYTLLYHNFGYIIPDALMVRLDKENNRYKLTFLEVEAKKPDWHNYVDQKLNKYHALAKDTQFYEYWVNQCKLLNLNPPTIEDLKFSVCIVGNIKKELGNGFQFIHTISDIS